MSGTRKELGREIAHLGGYFTGIPRLTPAEALARHQITAQPWGQLPYMPSNGFPPRPYWQYVRVHRPIHFKRG